MRKDYSDTFQIYRLPRLLMAIHLTWPARVTPATVWVSAYYLQGSNEIIVGNLQSEINKSCLSQCFLQCFLWNISLRRSSKNVLQTLSVVNATCPNIAAEPTSIVKALRVLPESKLFSFVSLSISPESMAVLL